MNCDICSCKFESSEENKKPVVLTPCGHTFCQGCHPLEGQHNCPTCDRRIERAMLDVNLANIVKRYEMARQPVLTQFMWMQTRIKKDFKI